MPRFVKFLLFLFLVIGLAVLGLYITGNEHLLRAVRSTYVLGRTGPDIDNHRFFENRIVEARSPRPWPVSDAYGTYHESVQDSILHATYRSTGYVVVHKGELLYEKYWEGESDTALSNAFSMAKSITSILVGMAIEDGLIGSVDDKASDYLDDLKGTDREDITIEHLLQMTSGIGFDEHYGDPFGFMAKAYYGDEIYEKTLSYPKAYEPGTRYEYLGGNTLLLSYIIEKVTGTSLTEYASKKLWTPLGAEQDALWTFDPKSGAERAYCCFYSNAKDFARMGELFLCHGNWNGDQLISPKWIEDSLTPSYIADPEGKPVDFYGYQWWIMDHQGKEVYYMRGILGQYVFVIPEIESVIVRLGHLRSDERTNNIPNDVFEYLDLGIEIVQSTGI